MCQMSNGLVRVPVGEIGLVKYGAACACEKDPVPMATFGVKLGGPLTRVDILHVTWAERRRERRREIRS